MRTHRVLSAQQHLGARGLTALAKAKQGSSTTEGATPSARGSSAAAVLVARRRICAVQALRRVLLCSPHYSTTVLQCYSATVQHANSLLRIASHRIASQSVPGSGRRRRRPRRPAATTIPAVPNRNVKPIATHATPHHTTPRHTTPRHETPRDATRLASRSSAMADALQPTTSASVA